MSLSSSLMSKYTMNSTEAKMSHYTFSAEWNSKPPPFIHPSLLSSIHFNHMMRTRPPHKIGWRTVSHPPPPGLLQTIGYEPQHVYLLRHDNVNHAILFLVKPNTSVLGTIEPDTNARWRPLLGKHLLVLI